MVKLQQDEGFFFVSLIWKEKRRELENSMVRNRFIRRISPGEPKHSKKKEQKTTTTTNQIKMAHICTEYTNTSPKGWSRMSE